MVFDKIRYFFPKIRNRYLLERNRVWEYCNVERVALRGYKPFDDVESFKRQLHSMFGDYDSSLFVGINDEERRIILTTADQALNHEFDLLGSGTVKLDPIDWHIDFKCGANWEKGFYRKIQTPQGADIKVPWELSRCQHLLWLGEAYILTGEEKYAKEVVDEINWWIDDNPLMYSVNWKCAMDVAFRAVNWMYALLFISSSKFFTQSVVSKICVSLYQHGFFIRNNLERVIPNSNNHYASDIVGLLYIGLLFNKTRVGRNWYRFAKQEYYKEVLCQVLPSGVHYEKSVSYHRLMIELFSYPLYMLNRIGERVPEELSLRVHSMIEYTYNYTKSNGFAPLIEDNDDGRFLPFLKRNYRDHKYLFDINSLENKVVSVGTNIKFEVPRFYEPFILYEDAGVAIYRKDEIYLYVCNEGYSKNPNASDIIIGTHTHNDLLSFEFNIGGKDVIIDPGTYLYTSSFVKRNEFRSTAKHNTIIVDGEEQNILPNNKMFQVIRNVEIDGFQKDGFNISGSYKTLKEKLSHHRTFTIVENSLVILDKLTKAGSGHKAHLHFHFAEGITPSVENNMITFFIEGYKVIIENETADIIIYDDTVSPSYGVLIDTKSADICYSFVDKLEIKSIISWTRTSNIR